MIPSLRKVKTGIEDLRQVQSAIESVINVIRLKELLDGRLVQNLFIENGTPYNLNHGLGKPIRGWVVVRKDAEADVWESTSTLPLRTIVLNSSADVTISIWLF